MLSDLRYAARQLFKAPGFTAAIVLSAALGIGATATVFCWMDSVLNHPIPGARDQQQLVVLAARHGDTLTECISLPDIRECRELKDVFVDVIGSQVTPACLDDDNSLGWIYGQITTANFFDALGVKPLLGRTFLAGEDHSAGGHPVLVLSEAFWQRRFNADPSIVGKTVKLNQHLLTVIGVVPAGFQGSMSGLVSDFWATLSMHQEVAGFGTLSPTRHEYRWLHSQARLRPGITPAQAQAALDTLSVRLERDHPHSNAQVRFVALPFAKSPYGAQPILGPVLRVLLVVCIGVLLIVAANISNLLLVRATARQKELAIRQALGASRGSLLRLLLSESLLLALLGGLLGLWFASLSLGMLGSFFPPTHLPVGLDISLNSQTAVFTLLLALFTGVVFGSIPAWHASRPNVNTTLKQGGRGSGTAGVHHRMRSLLVVSEIALALVLLIGAALCIKSVRATREIRLGFEPNRVLLTGLRIGMSGYDEKSGKLFYRELQQRLAALPGIEDVGYASWFPLGFEGTGNIGVEVDGYDWKPGEDKHVPSSIVSPRYLSTLGIPLIAGRDFNEQDDENSSGVIIVNETMARRFWPETEAVGHTLKFGGRTVRVVGVVADGKYRSLDEAPRCFVYRCYLQGVSDLNLGLCLRTQGDPLSMIPAVREEIRRLNPQIEPWSQQPMTQYVQAAFIAPAMAARMLSGLGITALALAGLGIYGVMAYTVGLRTQEFGVRMALGASRRTILRLVLGNGLVLAAAGVVTGLALAIGVTRFLSSLLYGVSPFDPLVFVIVPVFLALVSLVACLLPALRATRVDPVEALRAE